MNPLQQEQQSVSYQVDTIMANRNRRFKWLMKKDRVQDAIAVGEEFMEWMMLDQDDCNEEILYYKEGELEESVDK
jgi:hypothetical protein